MENHKNINLPERYSAKFIGSFAYITIKDRLPVILVKVIDTLCQDKSSILSTYGESAAEETKDVIGRLSELQNEMVTDKDIKPLVSDSPDVELWNKYMTDQKIEFGFAPSWFKSSWLYVECYLYRRMKQAFELSSHLQLYDPFYIQKEESFASLIGNASVICSDLMCTISRQKGLHEDTELFDNFLKYLELSLWGNKCDLSLSAGKSVDFKNPLSLLKELKENILVNNSEILWKLLMESRRKPVVQLDYVLDNAGFELFCDLCFLHFLHASKLINKVRIFVKTMPWFVSDTLEKDIDWILNTLSQSDHEELIRFSRECTDRLSTREWTIVKEHFWTLPHDFSEMKEADSQLYHKLSMSDLVMFKGDLNYRKLTGDRQWAETTPFQVALNGFLPTSVVTLRTIKADVVVGLQDGTSAKLAEKASNWKFTGDFALIQVAQKL